MQININNSVSCNIFGSINLKHKGISNKPVDKITKKVDLNNAYKIDIKRSLQNPESRISDKLKELFNEIVSVQEKDSSNYSMIKHLNKI